MRPAYSMWFWAINTVGVALLCIVFPQTIAPVFGATAPLTDSMLVLVRFLGIVMIGYGAAYGVAAMTHGVAFMRFSVVMRACILPALLVMVAVGWMPQLLLTLGVVDLVGALWTRAELRQRGTPSLQL